MRCFIENQVIETIWRSIFTNRSQINYISSKEYAQLGAEVVKYDPKISLTLGGDGLEAYRKILSQALEKLNKNGHIFLEIGYTQANAVGHLLTKAGFQQIRVHKDLGSRDRVISAKAS